MNYALKIITIASILVNNQASAMMAAKLPARVNAAQKRLMPQVPARNFKNASENLLKNACYIKALKDGDRWLVSDMYEKDRILKDLSKEVKVYSRPAHGPTWSEIITLYIEKDRLSGLMGPCGEAAEAQCFLPAESKKNARIEYIDDNSNGFLFPLNTDLILYRLAQELKTRGRTTAIILPKYLNAIAIPGYDWKSDSYALELEKKSQTVMDIDGDHKTFRKPVYLLKFEDKQ